MSTPTEIVAFRPYHAVLLAQLEASRQPLCPMADLVYPRPALARALTSFLALEEGRTWTFLFSRAGRNGQTAQGFVQAFQPAGRSSAWLLGLAPRLDREEARPLWHRLLGHLTAVAAERGLCSLYASAAEESAELETLSEAGFTVYAHEEILCLPSDAPLRSVMGTDVRPERDVDGWAIAQLYRAVTPHLVQQAELVGQPIDPAHPPISGYGEGFVLTGQSPDLLGYGYLVSGRRGHWLTLLVAPEAGEQGGQLVDYALTLLNYYPARPVYCAVRHYQNGLFDLLQTRGFRPFSARCCLVKHTAVRVGEPARVLVPAWENRVKSPTTTISPSETIKGVYER